jgi:Domain of unknown function (DUF397)
MTTSLRPLWRKSSYSNSNSNCAEVAGQPGAIAVRDSKDPSGPPLAVAPSAWRAFTRRIKGEPGA